jgi:hypothetical protein
LCHLITPKRGEFPVIPAVGEIRGRYVPGQKKGQPWLSGHTGFSHWMHRPIRCDGCHTRAASSMATSDVLLPDMKTCTNCHSGTGTAQDRCSQCHLYHDKNLEKGTRRSIQQLMSGGACPEKSGS